ncbi:hypothetical protein [Dokdonella immobilis]|uniref:Tetratricopeptide repeat-containing protein n=1 Tax=Dokdonella immobilis TaxID=578942 RepID=A0A1I5A7D3_9GAMM|nr:hypothetical protein [Dokdonella immobilis]SFN58270.1 hypothetical protein SAMN05216289_13316 [Dokdonella immobilis]
MFTSLAPRLVLAAGIALAMPAHASGVALSGPGSNATAHGYQSTNLRPGEADALRRKVLVQCGLIGSRNRLPWYFHFAYAQALLDAGDTRRAVVELSESINLRPEPRVRKRTYGMWFTDYLPYFQLAEAHAKLDNWPCAEHAMELSRSTGEAALGRIEPQRIWALQERIDRHVDDAGSCNIRDYR